MSKAKVLFQVCVCGHHVYVKNRMIATISKYGSVRWEIPDDESNSLPLYVLSAVSVFAEDVARRGVTT